VVHVLIDVLRKVQRALRPGGYLLLTQPANEITQVVVTRQGVPVFQGALVEPNFGRALAATKTALAYAVQEQRFAPPVSELVPPDADDYLRDEWDSVDVWETQTMHLSIDPEPLTALATQIRTLVGQHPHRLTERYKEEHLLLRRA
jgi:hypothetical protein